MLSKEKVQNRKDYNKNREKLNKKLREMIISSDDFDSLEKAKKLAKKYNVEMSTISSDDYLLIGTKEELKSFLMNLSKTLNDYLTGKVKRLSDGRILSFDDRYYPPAGKTTGTKIIVDREWYNLPIKEDTNEKIEKVYNYLLEKKEKLTEREFEKAYGEEFEKIEKLYDAISEGKEKTIKGWKMTNAKGKISFIKELKKRVHTIYNNDDAEILAIKRIVEPDTTVRREVLILTANGRKIWVRDNTKIDDTGIEKYNYEFYDIIEFRKYYKISGTDGKFCHLKH